MEGNELSPETQPTGTERKEDSNSETKGKEEIRGISKETQSKSPSSFEESEKLKSASRTAHQQGALPSETRGKRNRRKGRGAHVVWSGQRWWGGRRRRGSWDLEEDLDSCCDNRGDEGECGRGCDGGGDEDREGGENDGGGDEGDGGCEGGDRGSGGGDCGGGWGGDSGGGGDADGGDGGGE